MATEDGIEDKKSGLSWGKIALGAAAIGGATLVGLAVGGDDLAKMFSGADKATFLGQASNAIGSTLERGQEFAASTLSTLTGGAYKPENFSTLSGTPAIPATSETYVAPGVLVPAAPATEATLGLSGVASEIGNKALESGKAGLEFASNNKIITGGVVGTTAIAGVAAGNSWAKRVGGARDSRDSYVAQLEAERSHGPGAPSRA